MWGRGIAPVQLTTFETHSDLDEFAAQATTIETAAWTRAKTLKLPVWKPAVASWHWGDGVAEFDLLVTTDQKDQNSAISRIWKAGILPSYPQPIGWKSAGTCRKSPRRLTSFRPETSRN